MRSTDFPIAVQLFVGFFLPHSISSVASARARLSRVWDILPLVVAGPAFIELLDGAAYLYLVAALFRPTVRTSMFPGRHGFPLQASSRPFSSRRLLKAMHATENPAAKLIMNIAMPNSIVTPVVCV
jgi:hypothetical protein